MHVVVERKLLSCYVRAAFFFPGVGPHLSKFEGSGCEPTGCLLWPAVCITESSKGLPSLF